jgi:antitoxin VapB
VSRIAKVFMTNRSQAVRLPKEFRFKTREVFIRKDGDKVILTPRQTDWAEYLEKGPFAPPDFMQNVEKLPVQERRFWYDLEKPIERSGRARVRKKK